MNPFLSIVIPAFNENLNFSPLCKEILHVLSELQISSYEIILVDDGSNDNSYETIQSIAKQNTSIVGIQLSKNFGNQNALRAGLEHARGQYVVSMDADLQQPPAIIKDMLIAAKDGHDIILTKRIDTNVDLRTLAATGFYSLINAISSVPITYGSSDFRMLTQKALRALLQYSEYNTFFRGIIPSLGFKQHVIEYKARDRHSGTSKLSLKKLIQLALNGITSSSILPLRISTIMGIGISLIAFVYLAYAIYVKLFLKDVISGWASVIMSVLFLGGIQLIILGIVGEYIGKIFFEVKKRPHYIIANSVGLSSTSSTHEDR